MSTWLKVVLALLVLTVGGFVGGGKMLPSKVDLTVWQTVLAPHEHMTALYATPGSWPQWSVWAPLAAKAKSSEVTGPQTGVGAAWSFRHERGLVFVNLTAFEPPTRLSYEVYVEPVTTPFQVTVDLYDRGRSTKVRWVMTGDVGDSLPLRWIALFAPSFLKERYKASFDALGVLALARAHDAMQDALAAEEDDLIGKKGAEAPDQP